MLPGPNLADHLRDRLGVGGSLALFYGCFFVVLGVSMPYLYPWMQSRGLTVADIAMIASISPLMRSLCGPLFGFLADKHAAHRGVLVASSVAYCGAWLFMAQFNGFWTAILAQALIAASGAAMMPLIETLTVAGVKSKGIDYGRVRLWGSITFMLGSLIAGWLVDWRGLGLVIWLLVGGACLTVASAVLLPKPSSNVDSPVGGRAPIRVADALALVRQPSFLLFLAATGCIQSAHAALYVFGTLHWQSLGYSNGWCGALWAISVLAEILLFWRANTYARHLGPLLLLGVGTGASVFRWALMGFDPPLLLLIGLQALHGLTYAASHLGAIQFMARAVPPEQAGTAQSVYALVTGGVGMVVATNLAGNTYLAYGGGTYWAMAIVASVGALALLALARRWDGNLVRPATG